MPTTPGSRSENASTLPECVLPDVLEFMQLLWTVVHGFERTSKRMAREIGVTGSQRLVVRVVGLFPGISAGQLAVILRLHPSTVTGVLQRLVARRLLTRQEDRRDRRRTVLRLAARGERVSHVTHGTVEAAVANALDGAAPHDRAATRRVLERLARQLELAGPDV
jgi:MarR family transcriptional regulator, organic hydroperoxide resistance regulator